MIPLETREGANSVLLAIHITIKAIVYICTFSINYTLIKGLYQKKKRLKVHITQVSRDNVTYACKYRVHVWCSLVTLSGFTFTFTFCNIGNRSIDVARVGLDKFGKISFFWWHRRLFLQVSAVGQVFLWPLVCCQCYPARLSYYSSVVMDLCLFSRYYFYVWPREERETSCSEAVSERKRGNWIWNQ